MKSDLDHLLETRNFDAIVIMGHSTENHALNYMTSNAGIGEGYVLKKRGADPILIVGPMEREEAAKSGLTIETYNDYDFYPMLKETGSYYGAAIRMLAKAFAKHEIRGTVSFYGLTDPGYAFRFLTELSHLVPDITITGETETNIFDEAYTIKDTHELNAIKSVAERTNLVMSATVDYIKRQTVRDGKLYKSDSTPLTVGDVKSFVRTSLMQHRLEAPDDFIFARGRDAGVPHSRGADSDTLSLGDVIVFDLFPREIGGGYFHDMTRTFALGYATPEVQHAYDQVMFAYNQVISELAVGEKCGRYQDLTCDIFEEMGHPTIRKDPTTLEGYVHGLGHGLGLQIHARPRFRPGFEDTLQVGQVITIEPGLYYPDRGYGIRIEDTIYIDDQGQFHSLTPFPKDLIIPIGES